MTRRRVVLGAALALIGTGVSADRLLAWRAEHAVAERTGCSEADADVRGFPLIPQVISGVLDDVVVEVPGVERGSVAFDLRAELEGVQTKGDRHVDRAVVTATVDWTAMGSALEARGMLDGALAGAELEAADGAIGVVVGGDGALAPRVLISVTAENDTVVFRPIAVEVSGREVELEVVERLTGRELGGRARSVSPDVPVGFEVTDVSVGDDGVTVEITGEDLETGSGAATEGIAGMCAEAAG